MQSPFVYRKLLTAAGVIALHLAALWALQSGLVRHTVQWVIPVALHSELPTSQAPPPSPPSPPPRPAPAQRPPAMPRQPPAPAPSPPQAAPQAPAVRSALPPTTEVRPTAPVEPALPTQPGLTQASRPSATQAVSPAPPPPSLELPSSQASYLQNPAPIYPALSKRLGEQGKVLVRVLIGADGLPVQAQLKTSSGFDRLDRAALEYVMRCRYVPGKIGGVPQAMWHEAPVVFVLE